MSAVSKKIIQPLVGAVLPITDNIADRIADLYDNDYLDLTALRALVEDPSVVKLRRVDDPANPLIKTNEKTGEKMLVLFWGHPDKKKFVDVNCMVGILCKLERNRQGEWMYKPSFVMRGEKANVLIVGGMSCCGSAIQAHTHAVLDDGSVFDRGLMPVSGIVHEEHENWLVGKVYIADTTDAMNVLSHMAMDVLAHRAPDRFGHTCSSKADYLGYAARAGAMAPAPR